MSPSIDHDESSHRTLLLFGSQALSFDEAYFERIRLNVVGDKDNRWMIDVVEDLSTYWKELCEIIPSLRSLPGERWLKQHTHWLQHGSKEDQRPSQLPNIILSPLVIMGHLSEYVQHSAASGEGFQSEEAEYQRANTETLGFCIGLLSAFAVSSSSTRAQFCQNGAAAIRLAMVVGGLVDAQMAESESVSLTATWKSEQGATKLNEVLENFPDVSLTHLTLCGRFSLSSFGYSINSSNYRHISQSRMTRTVLLLQPRRAQFRPFRGSWAKLALTLMRSGCRVVFTLRCTRVT